MTCPSGPTRLPLTISAAVHPSTTSLSARAANLARAWPGSGGQLACSSSISDTSVSEAALLPRGDLRGEALSVGEAEYYALIKAVAEGLGLVALGRGLGYSFNLWVHVDSNT